MFGPPGAGKSAQGQLLEKTWITRSVSFSLFGYKLNFSLDVHAPHITTGSLLRNLCSDTQGKVSASVCETMKRGELVPDETLLNILNDSLTQVFKTYNTVILDGFPRSISQAKLLDSILKNQKAVLSKIIILEVKYEIVYKRIGGRKICDVF